MLIISNQDLMNIEENSLTILIKVLDMSVENGNSFLGDQRFSVVLCKQFYM